MAKSSRVLANQSIDRLIDRFFGSINENIVKMVTFEIVNLIQNLEPLPAVKAFF
jgi:hypothetical protein